MRQNNQKAGMFGRSSAQLRLAPPSRWRRIAGQVAATVAMMVAASVVAGSAGAATDTTTVTWHSPELPGFHSIYLPRLQCPSQFPYLLDKHFNPGSGFRLTKGVEFTGYHRGFDVVALATLIIPFERDGVSGHMNVGISGERDLVRNSATNWAFRPTRFTLILHCTSDPGKGAFSPRKDS